MKIFISCINGMGGPAAIAQAMVSDIAHQLGFRNMGIFCYDSSEESWESLSARYDGIIASITPGDIVFLQHPTWNRLEFEEGLIDRIKAYGGRVVIVVHDMYPLMFESDRYMLGSVIGIFNSAEVLVVPSYSMKKFLQENGIRENMKFIIQEIWDYTTDLQFSQLPEFQKEIHFAGSPSKFLFPQQWNYDVPLKIYTSEQCIRENVRVMGYMDSDNLLLELAKGGFGIVWYGDEYLHQYMKYNNNLKFSTYLAAGIPVIVPRGFSSQYLIEKNHLGLVVDSLEDAVEWVINMGEADYQEYVRHIRELSFLIRGGYFTRKFLIEAVQMLMRQDMTDYGIASMVCEETEHFSESDTNLVNDMDTQGN